MTRLLITLAVSLLAGTTGQTKSTKNEIHLRATVQDVVPLADYSGKVTPVDSDPRFVLTVRIESVDPASAVLQWGLSSHSPSTVQQYYLERMPTKARSTTFPYNVRLSMARQDFLA